MANVYYKLNNQYKHLSYADIDAAAANHKHSISNIATLNFKNNGMLGYNIFNTFDNDHQNGLLYVPYTNSDKIYNKLISNDILTHNLVPWYNLNKHFEQQIGASLTDSIQLNSDLNVLYEYKYIYNIKSVFEITNINEYFIYYYPLALTLSNIDTNITISFNINTNNIGSITFNTNNIVINEENIIIPNIFQNMGLYYNTNNQILGICFFSDENITEQIKISNIKILTNKDIYVSQKYEDYFDISDVPKLEHSGSLGSLKQYNDVKTNDMVKSYYRSYKFHNALTWGQTITIPPCIIPGFCSNNSYNIGYFLLYWPHEIDPHITTKYNTYDDYISLSGNIDIWIPGANPADQYKPLQKGNTNSNQAFNYHILTMAKTTLGIQIYFLTIPTTNISYMCPIQLIANNGLTVTIIPKPED